MSPFALQHDNGVFMFSIKNKCFSAAQVLNMATFQMSVTHSCRVCSRSRAIRSSLISASRLSTLGSSLLVTVLPSATTLGGAGRTGGDVLGLCSGFAGDGRGFSVLCNE